MLWTRYGRDGAEQLDFRALHVLPSPMGRAKRPSATTVENERIRPQRRCREAPNSGLAHKPWEAQRQHYCDGKAKKVTEARKAPRSISIGNEGREGESEEFATKVESDDETPIKQESCRDDQIVPNPKYLEDFTATEIAHLISQKRKVYEDLADCFRRKAVHGRSLASLLREGEKAFHEFLDDVDLKCKIMRRMVYFDLDTIPRRNN